MRAASTFGAVVALAAAILVAGKCSNELKASHDIVAAEGWSHRLIANGIKKPRSIMFDSAGGLLVVDSGIGITRLVLQDDGGTCLSVKSKTAVIEDGNVGVLICLLLRAHT